MDSIDPDRIKTIFLLMEYDELTEWELGFVESVEKQFNANGELTEPQYDKLEEVFERAAERA
ncbi:hypothetical protein LCGC14_0569480 [marine sediment metagenome]|uniref:Uncharacterized protein n=1 Tax=marine sediment metagenome TaxID=412755 RepID=A0A0F9RPP7_9ZZZZ